MICLAYICHFEIFFLNLHIFLLFCILSVSKNNNGTYSKVNMPHCLVYEYSYYSFRSLQTDRLSDIRYLQYLDR